MADNAQDEARAAAARVLLDARRHVLRAAGELEAAAAEQRRRAEQLSDMATRLGSGQLPFPDDGKAAG